MVVPPDALAFCSGVALEKHDSDMTGSHQFSGDTRMKSYTSQRLK